MVPADQDGLRVTFAQSHLLYTCLFAAVRYVAMNSVSAGLTSWAADSPWSSTRTLLDGQDDGVVTVAPVRDRFGTFAALLDEAQDASAIASLRRSRTIGRSVGADDWLAGLASATGQAMPPAKRGRKPQSVGASGREGLLNAVSR